MTVTSNQIVSIIPAGECPTLKAKRTTKQKQIQMPLGSAFACKISEMLRSASRTRSIQMINQMIAAGIDNIDGWSLDDLLNGRINPSTGVRMLPNGKVNRRRAMRDAAIGAYYGAVPNSPVTDLHQRGVVWQQA